MNRRLYGHIQVEESGQLREREPKWQYGPNMAESVTGVQEVDESDNAVLAELSLKRQKKELKDH